MNASIRSVCVRPQHRAIGAGPRTITVHEGAWAYCPDGAEGEHEWRTIEPIDLDGRPLRQIVVVEGKVAWPEPAAPPF